MAPGSPSTRQLYSSQQPKHRVTKRHGKKMQQITGSAGVFSCFSLAGDNVSLHKRSAFSSSRKREVRGIRKKGACLRCRLLKRACSGEDPCKTCIVAARAAVGSRALMWMDCIRPSFQMMNIFDGSQSVPDQGRIEYIIGDLLDDDVHLDFHIPFALNVEAASSHLASWLSDDHSESNFSVVGVFSCSTNTSLLENALDPNLGKDLRLFVHLTTHLYTTGMQGGYQEYSDEEICSVRDFVGNRLLLAFDALLRPSELEVSEDKLSKLRSLFLLILGTTVGMRYTCPEVIDEPQTNSVDPESKQEALMRLLCHYLIYIGKATSLLEASSDERALVKKWRSQWNKPAAFTWNCSNGLEMHYRIQPPAHWIVSSSEDESMSSIDFDLSELVDGDEFTFLTVNSDLLKCAACDTFWAMLDANGLCQNCQPPFGSDWTSQDSNLPNNVGVSFSSSSTIDADISLEYQLSAPWEDPSSWDSSLASSRDKSSSCIFIEDCPDFGSLGGNALEFPNSPLFLLDSCSCSSATPSQILETAVPTGNQPQPPTTDIPVHHHHHRGRRRGPSKLDTKDETTNFDHTRPHRRIYRCRWKTKCSEKMSCGGCWTRPTPTTAPQSDNITYDLPSMGSDLQDLELEYLAQCIDGQVHDDQTIYGEPRIEETGPTSGGRPERFLI
ncbi:hypothetical protein K505DRAFT_123005 [Melanomma pulvis-pyrius CBS 109.77]|uniref:Zn(2)-C6 fungal-type domain-containing protein n=1 Tax=Melanomma pulvis-pyrius CBS 109.77 TaxID=1314802 RepID=A0A6A6WU83_9PLEO|nr:hypothetical protein K505DRAFT_123005 [Melanomma pulvis-pyrius CBS 109.77]